MTKEEMLEKLQDILQTDAVLTPDTCLYDLDEWDSLSMMALMTFVNQTFGKKLLIADFKQMELVSDILAAVGI